MPQLSIIIPVFNEVSTLSTVIDSVRSAKLPDIQIVVVDDFSTDGTRELLQGPLGDEIDLVVEHVKNRGKGAALRTGIKAATGDYVVFQDADLEYDPKDLLRMLEILKTGAVDVVYGSRFLNPNIRQISPFWHRVVNRGLTAYSNFYTGLKLTDMETCYKMFPREILQSIELTEDRFGVEPELTAKAAAKGLRFQEIPIEYNRRTFDEGKKIGARDGVRALYVISKYGFVGSDS
ncbi:glycosyltransferase family 2 protein [Pelagicoccus sp. SDUM812003]|uniref:glycosyltransferase family 2 protein n=1 Tax=Pelagicoccus sp. SDUM812003 TaxID=3041267 RepID=UPI00280DB833|nr:glycosyltransferase family 2 protein [Pelagicoccus sp. SDUM812003]MDQ8202513.1 glycosyltransferase family 2 protein [Pelagicoccus sp. SDUM812003]